MVTHHGGVDATEHAFELGTDGPRSILVGVDGSEPSLRAGAYAAGLARRQGSRLTAVFARTPVTGATAAFDQTGAAPLARLAEHDAVEAELRELLERHVHGVDAEVVVRRGAPLKVLLDVAEEVRAEAVVVGSSRPGAFLRGTGPLSVQLVKTRRWPVVVVP